jgi:protein-S-isoprenylcysteine O-methyltransferase Ste14
MNDRREKTDFEKQLNISYVPPDTPRPNTRYILRHCLSSICLYGVALLIILYNPYYQNIVFNPSVRKLLIAFYIAYIVLALPLYLFFKPKSLVNSKSILIVGYLDRLRREGLRSLPGWIKGEKTSITPTYKEQQAILLFMVKFFFGPFMMQWAFDAVSEVSGSMQAIKQMLAIQKENWVSSINFRGAVYLLLIQIFLLVDISFYAAGYFWEAGFLQNRVRTVESTFLGIIVCIACYPPFNDVTANILSWVPNNTSAFFGDSKSWWTWGFRIVAIICLYVYACASVALFTKASNLTNRGIVTIWPYSMVRHPAYIGKNLFWWLTGIPIFFSGTSDIKVHMWMVFSGILSLSGWSLIYYLRAITEERHLSKDPDYIEYMKKVKYRFIPGLF